jgi:hypothetical protein
LSRVVALSCAVGRPPSVGGVRSSGRRTVPSECAGSLAGFGRLDGHFAILRIVVPHPFSVLQLPCCGRLHLGYRLLHSHFPHDFSVQQDFRASEVVQNNECFRC